ncbi:MAG TPA: hypothetical protein VGF99_03350 [Myxococcota bacterium]
MRDDAEGVRTLLHLQVPKVPRPRTRLEAAAGYRLRLVVDDVPLLLARIEPSWDEAFLLRGVQASPRVLDAIDRGKRNRLGGFVDERTSGGVGGETSPPPDTDTLRAHHLDDEGWCRFFTERVLTSSASPLYKGDWCVSTLRPVPRAAAWTHPFASMDGHRLLPPAMLPTTTTTTTTTAALPMTTAVWEIWSYGADDERVPQGELLARRALDDDDEGRRRFWRKQARAAALPPVLVWFVPLLQKFVVLDGHVRLLAALDEGVTPTLVCLWAARVEARRRRPMARGCWRW